MASLLSKTARFPALSDVAALADVLNHFKKQTNSFLDPLGPFEAAFITVPNLHLEDLMDATEYPKIQLLRLPGYIHRSGDQARWSFSDLNKLSHATASVFIVYVPEPLQTTRGPTTSYPSCLPTPP